MEIKTVAPFIKAAPLSRALASSFREVMFPLKKWK